MIGLPPLSPVGVLGTLGEPSLPPSDGALGILGFG